MYGGGNTFEGIDAKQVKIEDQEKLTLFEARIQRGEKIEASDYPKAPGSPEHLALNASWP
jgi:ring-1,2-phenylacetyl-CoA epoxidase subunit PaaA